jgi:hypothetical protein
MNSGTFVVVHLVTPKEKYWGVLRAIGAAGITIRGIDVDLFDEWARQVRNTQEPELGLATLFVPLHRVEKIFEDGRIGAVGSYQERFFELVGRGVRDYMGDDRGSASPADSLN